MAHYAFLDENNVVVEVIVGKDENEDGIDWEQHYSQFRGMTCKRTSYNSREGVHYNSDGTPSGKPAFRKNYAGIGFTYDPVLDAFIGKKHFPSWVLDENTGFYKAPVPQPQDAGYEKIYKWNEETLSWVEVTNGS